MIRILLMAAVSLTLVGCASAKNKHQTNTAAENTASTTTINQVAQGDMSGLEKVSCTKKQDTRVLDIIKDGPGCKLNYEKFGKTSAVATSMRGMKHCISSQKKIRTHLEHYGFKCA